MNENWAPCLIGSQEGKKKGSFDLVVHFTALLKSVPVCFVENTIHNFCFFSTMTEVQPVESIFDNQL